MESFTFCEVNTGRKFIITDKKKLDMINGAQVMQNYYETVSRLLSIPADHVRLVKLDIGDNDQEKGYELAQKAKENKQLEYYVIDDSRDHSGNEVKDMAKCVAKQYPFSKHVPVWVLYLLNEHVNLR